MHRDDRLEQFLVEFAHTLGTDFSVQEILDRLVQRVVELLPVTAAGVMVVRGEDDLHFVAHSNETIEHIEWLQNRFVEGPCLEAYRTGEAVAVPDLSRDERFPHFSPRALRAGLAAVFTFPMRLKDSRLGALDLYRDSPGPLSATDMEVAQVLADVAAAYLFNAQSRMDAAQTVELLRHRSLHDPLTGLPNRVLLTELVEQAVARARRSHLAAAVLFVDLDRFKSVNDRFGHQVGDDLLVAVSQRLRSVLRPGDTLARLAGDEFVIVCEDLADPAQAELVARRIGRTMGDPFDLGGQLVSMSASVGIAFSGPGEDIPDSLLRDADHAMYQAKAAGGGHHQVGDHSARLAGDHRVDLARELSDALESEAIHLVYQPIARARDGELTAVEALLRWEHPERGAIAPEVLVPIAERTGQIVRLGEWVLRRACADFVRWHQTYGDACRSVAVNVSAHQVMATGFAATVADAVRDSGMDASRLHLEVTESVFLEDATRATVVLGELREMGAHLSLDDFGTGYSCLHYLGRLPFDIVKISGSFVSELASDKPTTHAIVAAVIDLARALGLQVVAEGVETQAQLRRVVDLGGDLAQGFLLGRPLPAVELERQVLSLGGADRKIILPAGAAQR